MKNTPCAVAWFGTAFLMMSVGCGRSDTVGQLCDLTVDAVPSQGVVNLKAGACKTGLCLKPVLAAGSSVIDPPTGATCTDGCSSDSDCGGDLRNPTDAQDARCKGGFVCAVPFVVGPLCCKHYCLCKDFLGGSGAQVPVACQGPDALASCQSAAGSAAVAGIGQETDMYITVAPVRQLDVVFMIDNSPSMAPKVNKLAQQFPKLLAALKDPNDGRYPDLRVAIIDSDLGTGGAYQSGPCGPTASPDASNIFGDLGNFQMRGAVGCGTNADALWLDYYAHGKPPSYDPTKDISQVFGCLAGNLGALGCGQEHQLQSFEFALAAQNLHQNQSGGLQNAFIRPQAYLGLVILSDEDDCSAATPATPATAATNPGMFGDKPELRGESTSLRCATRAHPPVQWCEPDQRTSRLSHQRQVRSKLCRLRGTNRRLPQSHRRQGGDRHQRADHVQPAQGHPPPGPGDQGAQGRSGKPDHGGWYLRMATHWCQWSTRHGECKVQDRPRARPAPRRCRQPAGASVGLLAGLLRSRP